MSALDFYLPLDLTGLAYTNLIVNEIHPLGGQATRFLVLDYGAFYTESLSVRVVNADGTLTALRLNDQVWPVEMLSKTTLKVGKEIQCALLLTDASIQGTLNVTYQALGGSCSANTALLKKALDAVEATRNIDWANLSKPKEFNPAAHLHDAADLYGLEFIQDELKRIAEIVNIGDNGIHDEILDQMFVSKSLDFFNTFDNDFNNSFDFIINQSDIVSENLRKTNEVWLDVKKAKERVRKLTDQATLQNAEFETRDKSAVYAMTLMGMSDQLWAQKGLVLNVPELIGGLSAWLKFSDPSTVKTDLFGGFTIKDKMDPSRVFSGTGVQYVKNAALNNYAARFTGQFELLKVSGSPVVVNAPSTLYVVTAKASSNPERLDILSGPAGRLTTDISRGILFEFNDFVKTTLNAYAKAGCDRGDRLAAHIGVCAFSADEREDYVLSNTPESNYRGYHGFDKKPVRASIWSFDRIGHKDYTQSGDLLEIIVFNQQHSRREADAVLKYLRLQYGLDINLIVNGAFNDGLAEFETEYSLSKNADVPGEIAVVHRENSNNFSGPFAQFYVFKSMVDLLRSTKPRTKFLAVNTASASKSFWKQKTILDRFVNHELNLTLLSEDSSVCSLVLKLNGVELAATSRKVIDQFTQKLTYTLRPSTDFCEFALYNSKVNTILGLMDLQLVRKPVLK